MNTEKQFRQNTLPNKPSRCRQTAQMLDNRKKTSLFVDNRQRFLTQKKMLESSHDNSILGSSKYKEFSAAPVQCLMSQHTKKQGKWDDVSVKDVEELGYGTKVMIEYANMLLKDSNALVKGDGSHKDIAGLHTLLEEAELKDRTILNDLVDMVAFSQRNDELTSSMKESFEEYLRLECGLSDEEEEVMENYTDDFHTREWMLQHYDGILNGSKISEIDIKDLPDEWSSDIANAFYLQVRQNFYPRGSSFAPYIQSFIQLISDINSGKILKLAFNRKYRLGAEFLVDAPTDLQTKYKNEAVVHTHYDKDDGVPTYGHTKPYWGRYDRGYKYTKVNLSKILAIDDTKKILSSL